MRSGPAGEGQDFLSPEWQPYFVPEGSGPVHVSARAAACQARDRGVVAVTPRDHVAVAVWARTRRERPTWRAAPVVGCWRGSKLLGHARRSGGSLQGTVAWGRRRLTSEVTVVERLRLRGFVHCGQLSSHGVSRSGKVRE